MAFSPGHQENVFYVSQWGKGAGSKGHFMGGRPKPTLNPPQNHRPGKGPQSHFTDEEPKTSDGTTGSRSHSAFRGAELSRAAGRPPQLCQMPPGGSFCKLKMRTYS